MADIPSVPPAPPSAPAPVVPPAGLKVIVQQAPPALTALTTPVHVTATVVASNPQTQQITLQTPQGQIIVQSPVSLPVDAKVMLDLFMEQAQMRATLTVMKQDLAQQKALDTIITPTPLPELPPLKEG